MNNEQDKVIIVSAPSGAGKSTIVNHLLKLFPVLGFSISATTRCMRPGEQQDREYHFISEVEFKKMIANDELLEWQEVYAGSYYGTPVSEIKRLHQLGKVPIFDVDVKGGINIQKLYKEKSLSVFIKTPSFEVLEQRLRARRTETEESIQKRLAKARMESEFEDEYDIVIVNDKLEDAYIQAEKVVGNFLAT